MGCILPAAFYSNFFPYEERLISSIDSNCPSSFRNDVVLLLIVADFAEIGLMRPFLSSNVVVGSIPPISLIFDK